MIKKILIGAILFVNGSMFADVFYNDCCVPDCNPCDPCYEFAFWFDPMAVKPCQSDIQFASTSSLTGPTLGNQEFLFLHPEWSFGFRVGAGIKPQCIPWSFRADYTHWYNKTSGSTTLSNNVGGTTGLTPSIARNFLSPPFFVVPIGEEAATSTTLKYHYNLLDLTTGWSCCACSGLEISPFSGFRGLWYSTNVEEVNSSSDGVFSPSGDTSTASNDYHAFGLVGGLRLTYNFWKCFNFYGLFSSSVVGGRNHNHMLFTSLEFGPLTSDQKTCLFVYSFEGAWGASYDTCICGYNTHIGLNYEVTLWKEELPNAFDDISATGGATKASNGLYIQAITARFAVAF